MSHWSRSRVVSVRWHRYCFTRQDLEWMPHFSSVTYAVAKRKLSQAGIQVCRPSHLWDWKDSLGRRCSPMMRIPSRRTHLTLCRVEPKDWWSSAGRRECWGKSRSLRRCEAQRETIPNRSEAYLAISNALSSAKSHSSRQCLHALHKYREDRPRCPALTSPRSSWAWALPQKWA